METNYDRDPTDLYDDCRPEDFEQDAPPEDDLIPGAFDDESYGYDQ